MREWQERKGCGLDRAGKKTWSVTVTVVSQERGDSGPFDFGASYQDGSLDRVIASLNAIRDSIPPEYRAVARCSIESTSGYEDSHYATIEVNFQRPATEAEITRWDGEEQREQERAVAKERAIYEQLKQKYGSR